MYHFSCSIEKNYNSQNLPFFDISSSWFWHLPHLFELVLGELQRKEDARRLIIKSASTFCEPIPIDCCLMALVAADCLTFGVASPLKRPNWLHFWPFVGDDCCSWPPAAIIDFDIGLDSSLKPFVSPMTCCFAPATDWAPTIIKQLWMAPANCSILSMSNVIY